MPSLDAVINKLSSLKKAREIIPDLSVSELEEIIIKAAEAYYNSPEPILTDEIYDLLIDRLTTLKPNSKVLKYTGAPIAKGKKVKLPYWLGSMDKVKADEDQIESWTEEYSGPYVISDKLDGISCLLTCTAGEIHMYTRGSGNIGQDITHLADISNTSIKTLIKTYQKNGESIAIRGELIMKPSKFRKYADLFSNPRNMVAGIVNSKIDKLDQEAARDVDLVTYEIIEPEMKPSRQMKRLKELGLNVVHYNIYKNIDVKILTDLLERRRIRSAYQIDGIIITDNHIHPRNTAGNPSYSFAFKGTTPTANVKVINVIWDKTKDGLLIPVIHYEPVHLGGVEMKRTLGFNARFIEDHMIGPGAIITIIRSGDVIPYILGVVKPAKKPELPIDIEYIWDKNHVNILLKDPNSDPKVIARRITKFLQTIGVEYMSEGIVRKLVNAGYDNIFKILKMKIEDYEEFEGFAHRMATKLYTEVQSKTQEVSLPTLMDASNAFGHGLGERMLKKVIVRYPDIVKDYNPDKRSLWESKLLKLDGYSNIMVAKFLDHLPEFQKFYAKIIKYMKVQAYKPPSIKKSGLFKNQVVVFTGFRNDTWQNYIEEQGGKVANSVSGNTTLLIYNDGEEGSSKYKKAQELGIKIISRSDFAKKYKI
jgi:NAD-dependent DNA ligase